MIINADFVWPIGSIYISVNSTNPSKYFGGTWVQFAKGRTLVGVDTVAGDPDLTTVLKQGGEYFHTLTTLEMPSHTHNLFGNSNVGHSAGVDYWNLPSVIEGYNYGVRKDVYTNNTGALATGGGQAHNNMQPYITVYMWRRTA